MSSTRPPLLFHPFRMLILFNLVMLPLAMAGYYSTPARGADKLVWAVTYTSLLSFTVIGLMLNRRGVLYGWFLTLVLQFACMIAAFFFSAWVFRNSGAEIGGFRDWAFIFGMLFKGWLILTVILGLLGWIRYLLDVRNWRKLNHDQDSNPTDD